MDNYKLIIFGADWDVYLTAYKELIDNPHITYISTFRPRGLWGQVQRIQFNPKLNHIINIPGKSSWNKYYLRNIKGEKLCFLIMEKWLRHESGMRLLPFLRKHYPQAKVVCFTQDLIKTIIDKYTGKEIDTNYIKRYTDLFISYDETDAKKYQLACHSTVFSSLKDVILQRENHYDLFFLGRDKGRLPLLFKICKEANRRGLRCKFVMIEVPQEQRITCEGIEYADSEITYADNLNMCAQSRCLVELTQQSASSSTFRTWETIMLNKKLLTNNLQIKKTNIYDRRYISVFQDNDDIDWDFIEKDNDFSKNNPFQEQIRPKALVRFIEEKLQINILQA